MATTSIRPFAVQQFLELGLSAACKNDNWKRWKESSELKNFIGEHGVHPLPLSVVWVDLQDKKLIANSDLPLCLLVGCRWMTQHESAKGLNRKCGIGEAKIRDICKRIPQAIAALRQTKVRCAVVLCRDLCFFFCSLMSFCFRLIQIGKMTMDSSFA